MKTGIFHLTPLTKLNACHLFFAVMALLVFMDQTPAASNTADESATTNVIPLNANNDNANLSPDFDGDGVVGIPDFLLFVDQFGLSRGDEGYDTRFDLDGSHTIGIGDFLIFVDAFGKEVPSSSRVVTIPDANLRAAIEAALGKASGTPITANEMEALTTLTAQDAGISDLTGLESATNLTRLWLGRNNITDISALAGLNNLTELVLGGNNITDISALAGLNNLTYLGLSNNNVRDISALVGLTNLTYLWLGGNNITDISALAGLNNLTELVLERNNITNISALAGLNNLTYLGLTVNNITDISALAGLNNLTELGLGGNNITDISALAGLNNLTYLGLWTNNVRDISALVGLTNLTRLRLETNNVRDISALAGLTNLTELGLGGNNVRDISALVGLTNLTRLNLTVNNITDISALAGLNNVTLLYLGINNITDISVLAGLNNVIELELGKNNLSDADISALAGLTNLTYLGLSYNNITDISALAGLNNLTRLGLGGNNITDISTLAGLTNLTYLSLSYNNITDISALAGLTNLRKLFLQFNTITDISALSGLNNLTDLELRANFLTDSSVNDHIPVLESNGVRVIFDSFRVVGDFDIELIFLNQFTESQKKVLQYVARRWMAVITEDLPDYEFTQGWSGMCGDQPYEISSGERIDDLRIYLSTFEGGRAVGWGGPRVLRDETHLPVLGCMAFDLERVNLLITGLHEIGHVLGFGTIWDNLGFRQNNSPDDLGADTHFNGPLAIAAFNDAGGRNYTGAKVPVEKMDGSHWRYSVFPSELMRPGGGGALSAITVQSLADLGYDVDVTQADAYTLPGTALKASTKIAATLPSIPSYGVDVTQADAYTPLVVGPHWQGKVSGAAFSIPEDDRLKGYLESTNVGDRGFDFDVRNERLMGRVASPTQAEPLCGIHLRREPIHVVNQQGRIIRTIRH